MNHIEGAFKSARDDDIYYQAWLPEEDVRAALIVVHGIGEHSGRYMNVVNYLVPRGYAVYGFDHVGHGRSGGIRELVVRFNDYTTTLTRYCDLVRSRETGKPVFLLGHSMGGLIASHYLLDHQASFRGAVLAAPSIKAGASVSPVSFLVTKVLSVIAPGARVLALDASGISRDPQVVAAYVFEGLYHEVFNEPERARVLDDVEAWLTAHT